MDKVFKKRSIQVFLLVLATLFFTFSVNATANTHINISLSEKVYQNVSYGKDFIYSNQQESCMVMGSLNISNPEAETVFDIYLKFENIDKMTTDFVWNSGRDGRIIRGGAAQTLVVPDTIKINDTYNNYTLTLDLDNDGNTDYMWVNSTDIVFNLSSDGLVNVSLRDGGVAANIGAVPQDINMQEVTIASTTKTYGNLTIIGTTHIIDSLYGNETNITINEYYDSPIVIHVPELRSGNHSYFKYNMSCFGKNPPVEVITVYSNNDHPDVDNKVLAGYNWTLNQTVVNNNNLAINNINITMSPQSVLWNDSRYYDFAFSNLANIGDGANVDTVSSATEWYWTPNSGTLASGANRSIKFNMTAPYSVPVTASYLALLENITYEVSYLLTNLSLTQINGSGDIDFDFEKRIVRPQDNLENSNVTWEIIPKIYSQANITYNLHKVTLWVTHNMNPLNYTGLNKTFNNTPYSNQIAQINLSSSWGDSAAQGWYFNYTDGSNSTNPPPIVWLEPEWLISHKAGQIKNFTQTVSGNDLYLKYIYVVHGYWLRVEKNISNVGEGQYRINVTVTNIGNGWTPKYERVTVYDFVPNEFAAGEFTDLTWINESIGTAGSDYYGKAYKWDLPWIGTMNSSLGPSRGPDAETNSGNYSWTVEYVVNGSGEYRASQLYIVGLDPLKVDGAFASPIITIITGIQSYTHEIIYIGVIGFLIVLNVTNLVMTNRINRKITERIPPPPPPTSGMQPPAQNHGHQHTHDYNRRY